VRYLNAEKRRKYLVTLGQRIVRERAGLPLDTREVQQHCIGAGRTDLGSAVLGKSRGGQPFRQPDEWKGSALIWVCAPDPETDKPAIYTHVCKIRRFHRSSFTGGEGVIGAGEWVVRDGKLLYVSANSGHYRPDLHTFHRAVLHMAPTFEAETKVFMYDTVGDAWVHRPMRDLISAPSGNGRYKTHPEA